MKAFLTKLFSKGAAGQISKKHNVEPEGYLFSMADQIQTKERKVGFSGLEQQEQIFFLAWSLEAEVNNGGFDQFFFNSAGDHAAQTVEALKTIGAAKAAAIVKRAIHIFAPEGSSPDRNQRQQQLESLSEQQHENLEELDSEFYAYPDNLSQLLAGYMEHGK